MFLDGHRFSGWSTFLRSTLLLFPSNFPPWYSSFLTLHSFSQSSLRGQTFSKPSNKCSLDRSANEVLMGVKHQLQAFCCQDCWIQWEVYYIAVVLCLFLVGIRLKIIPKKNIQRSYGSLCSFFPCRTSSKSGNCYAVSCQLRYCITWGQWLVWISYQDFST